MPPRPMPMPVSVDTPGPVTNHSNHTTRVLDPMTNLTAVDNENSVRSKLSNGGDATPAEIAMLQATKSYRK